MTRSLKNILLNAVLAPKESAHQFDTTRRIKRFFNAAAAGDVNSVKEILKQGINTEGYENRNLGMFGTKEWQLTGLGRAIDNGRAEVVQLLAPEVIRHFSERINSTPSLFASTLCEGLVDAMRALRDHANVRASSAATGAVMEKIVMMSDILGSELACDKKQAAQWRRFERKRSVQKLLEDFQQGARHMVQAANDVRALTPAAEKSTREAKKQIAELRRIAKEAEAKAAAAEIAAIPVNATQLKRSLRPVKTVRFKPAPFKDAA